MQDLTQGIESPNGASAKLQWIERAVSCSGPITEIPPLGVSGLIFGVETDVLAEITGCASMNIDGGYWGENVGVASGAHYSCCAFLDPAVTPRLYTEGATPLTATPLTLAAEGDGAKFTGGSVLVSVLILAISPPTS